MAFPSLGSGGGSSGTVAPTAPGGSFAPSPFPASPPSGPLLPWAALYDSKMGGAPLATTTGILDYEIAQVTDGPWTFQLTVSLADAGAASSSGALSFASAFLSAAKEGASIVSKALLLEFSLDGGQTIDLRCPVERAERKLDPSGGNTISTQADDAFVLYATLALPRTTYTGVKLSDALNGARGAIQPVRPEHALPPIGGPGGGTLPNVQGLFRHKPGLPTWNSGGRARATFTPRAHNAVKNAETYLDSWGDYVSGALESLCQRLGGLTIADDWVAQSTRGHYVADSSDAPLNLSGSMDLGGGALTRSVVVGNAGGRPAPGFVFSDVVPPGPYDETAQAPVYLAETTVAPDLKDVFAGVRLEGGASSGDFPSGENAKVVGLAVLNPVQSGAANGWTQCLCIVAVGGDVASGAGLYYHFGDGAWRPFIKQCGGAPTCLAQHGSVLYIGTDQGVYAHSADPLGTDNWLPVGSLGAAVRRLQATPDQDTTSTALYALCSGLAKGHHDGIFRASVPPSSSTYAPGAGLPDSGLAGGGYVGWGEVLRNDDITDFLATDWGTVWYALKAGAHQVYRMQLSPVTTTGYQLEPGNLAGLHVRKLCRAITASPPLDSVWAIVDGSNADPPQPAYVLVNDGSWGGSFLGCDPDGSLTDSAGQAMALNSVVGLGLTFGALGSSGNASFGDPPLTPTVFACTNAGLYYSETLPPGPIGGVPSWSSANGTNGLDGFALTNVAAGQAQAVVTYDADATTPGTVTRWIQRIYCAGEKAVYGSSDGAQTWSDLTKSVLDVGPYLSQIVRQQTGDWPSNAAVTIGPASAAPLAGMGGGTHVTVPGCLPAGFYWQRTLTQHNTWEYWLYNAACPVPHTLVSQVSSLQASELVPAQQASSDLARTSVYWLGTRQAAQMLVQVHSAFSTSDAALRRLRPTHRVPLHIVETMGGRSESSGAITTTQVANFAGTLLYVVAHSIRKGKEGGPYCETVTTLAPLLRRDQITPDDIAGALQKQVKAMRIWTRRRAS